MKYKIKCKECNIEFETDNSKRIFCSKKCLSKNKTRRYNTIHGSRRYNKICEYCHTEYKSYHKLGKFCSNECSHKSRKKYINIPDCLENSHRIIDKNIGYVRVYCPMHREANTRGYVYEHRLIGEQKIGRDLLKNEVVHHINGIRWDNRPENLEVMNKYEHGKLSNKQK